MSRSNILLFRDLKIKKYIGKELYDSVQPIIINNEEIRSIRERRKFIESFAETMEEYKTVYTLNKTIQKLGKKLNFDEIGSYDEVYFFYLLTKKSTYNIIDALKKITSEENFQSMYMDILDRYF